MMYCPNCNKELEDGAMFCDGCGAQIPMEEAAPVAETVFCPQCGQQTDASAPYCQSCGAVIGEAAPAPKAKKGFPVKALVIGGIALVAIAAIVIAAILIFGGGRNNKYVAYYKDGELWFNNFSDESMEVSSKLLDYEGATKEDLKYGSYSGLVQMSADGKTMFFPDKYEGKGDYTIYYRDVTDPESEAVKIDSSIDRYSVNKKGDKIVYMKDVDTKYYGEYTSENLGTIKIGALDETEKVASDAVLYSVNSSYDTVIYYQAEEVTRKENDREYKDADYTYYLWKDGEKTKICDGDIDSFYIMDKYTKNEGYKKFTKVCYVKDEVLYVQEIGEDAEKIDSEVSYISNVYESGDIYYVKEGKEILNSDVYSFEEGVDEEYKKEKYTTTSDLYCYADGESAVIVEGYSHAEGWAEDEQIAVIVSTNWDSVKKVKTSDDNYWSKLRENIEKATTLSVLADGVLTEVDVDDYVNVEMTDDGSSIYFFCVGTEKEKDSEGNEIGEKKKDKGDIKLVTVKKGSVGAPEDYDTDVSYNQDNYSLQMSLNRKDELVYYKEYNAEKGKATLVIAQEEIDSDVRPGSVSTLKNGSYVYYVDWNSDADKQCGTLKISKKGEATVVADDVHSRVVTPDGEILYLVDYSTEKARGELYRYNNGKNEKIDEDVTYILPIYVWEED